MGWDNSSNGGGNNNATGFPSTNNSARNNAKSRILGIKMNVTYIIPLLLVNCVAFAIVIWWVLGTLKKGKNSKLFEKRRNYKKKKKAAWHKNLGFAMNQVCGRLVWVFTIMLTVIKQYRNNFLEVWLDSTMNPAIFRFASKPENVWTTSIWLILTLTLPNTVCRTTSLTTSFGFQLCLLLENLEHLCFSFTR